MRVRIRRSKEESRGQREDATTLALQMKEAATSQWCRKLLEDGKDEETDFPLEPSKGARAHRHLDFSLVKMILDFWPTEL